MSAHQGERAAFEESARLAVEAISNIRTVASLRLEGALAQRFDASLAAPYRDRDQVNRERDPLDYRVIHTVRDRLGWAEVDLVVPLSAQFCLGR